jgi:hypothetical protein
MATPPGTGAWSKNRRSGDAPGVRAGSEDRRSLDALRLLGMTRRESARDWLAEHGF